MAVSAMKARFINKEGRDDFRKLFLIFKNTKIKKHNMMMNNFKDIKVAVTSTGTMPVWML